MPTYEYECASCGVFEVDQRITEDALTLCPTCKKNGKKQKISRIISAPAFHLKGGGWYKDLYSSTKKDSGDSGSSSTSSSSANSSSSSEGSSKGEASSATTPSTPAVTASAGSSEKKEKKNKKAE